MTALRQNILDNIQLAGTAKNDLLKIANAREDAMPFDKTICKAGAYEGALKSLEVFTGEKSYAVILNSVKGLKRNPAQGDCI